MADVSFHECYEPEISGIRQPDFFHYFIGRGLQLLKESQEQHAFLDFVVLACLWETKYLEKLRMHLRTHYQVNEVNSSGQYAVSKDVQLSSSVFSLQKGPQQPEDDSHEIQYVPSLHLRNLCFSNPTDTEGLLENARIVSSKNGWSISSFGSPLEERVFLRLRAGTNIAAVWEWICGSDEKNWANRYYEVSQSEATFFLLQLGEQARFLKSGNVQPYGYIASFSSKRSSPWLALTDNYMATPKFQKLMSNKLDHRIVRKRVAHVLKERRLIACAVAAKMLCGNTINYLEMKKVHLRLQNLGCTSRLQCSTLTLRIGLSAQCNLPTTISRSRP